MTCQPVGSNLQFQQNFWRPVTFIGPDGHDKYSAYTDKVPLAFDGHTSYAASRKDVELWKLLTQARGCVNWPAQR